MIEKAINKYYVNTLIRCFENWILPYNLNQKIIIKNNIVKVYIKHRKFDDKFYKQILTFRAEDAIIYLSNFNKTNEEFMKAIKYYIDNEV